LSYSRCIWLVSLARIQASHRISTRGFDISQTNSQTIKLNNLAVLLNQCQICVVLYHHDGSIRVLSRLVLLARNTRELSSCWYSWVNGCTTQIFFLGRSEIQAVLKGIPRKTMSGKFCFQRHGLSGGPRAPSGVPRVPKCPGPLSGPPGLNP